MDDERNSNNGKKNSEADQGIAVQARRKYEKPEVRTESLTAVAALCNGTATGGRKATAPTPCQASRLKS